MEYLEALINSCTLVDLKQKAQKEYDIMMGFPDSWINVEDETPFEEQIVWYLFECSGKVCAGQYTKTNEGHVFYGEHGFCCNDVKKWLPIEWYKPRIPKK